VALPMMPQQAQSMLELLLELLELLLEVGKS
jgi:hypothetical protein